MTPLLNALVFTALRKMWLLSTHTAELKFFASPDDVPGGYAILSHVWGRPEEEDTFQKLQAAMDRCRKEAGGATDNRPGTPSNTHSGCTPPLSAQVQSLTSRLQELVCVLQSRLPALRNVLSSLPTASSHLPVSPTQPSAPHVSTNPRDFVSVKIRNFLLIAEEHGFDWAWSDTCCIDKTSSADLTEGINSMFLYYSFSDVCYAYLSDVSSDCDLTSSYSEFTESRWHGRGWTL